MQQLKKLNSNTTLVKVKLLWLKMQQLKKLNSNTTLVKVKLPSGGSGPAVMGQFKYNSC